MMQNANDSRETGSTRQGKEKLSDINNTKLQNKKIIYVNDRWELLNCDQLMMIKMG